MSYQRLFSRPRALSLAFILVAFPCAEVLGALAQSSATVSWATAFSSFPAAGSIYNAGDDVDPMIQSASFSDDPTNSATQGLNFGDLDTGASALADSSVLSAESHATNSVATLSASMFSYLSFENLGSGLLSITVPYTLSTLVQPGVGSSSVTVFASLDIIDFMGGSTPAITPEPSVSLNDSGLGTPNDLTGMLSLTFNYDENTNLGAVLNIGVITQSNATPIHSVPIPGGVALALPVLFPLFANRTKTASRSQLT